VWGSIEEREPRSWMQWSRQEREGLAGREGQPLLIHRAVAGPGKRGAWRPSRGPPSSVNTLPSFGPVAGGREGCGDRSAGLRGTTEEGEAGSRRQRKREEVWGRSKMRWPGEQQWPEEAPWEDTGTGWEQAGETAAGRD
jgi:hypothetical protein